MSLSIDYFFTPKAPATQDTRSTLLMLGLACLLGLAMYFIRNHAGEKPKETAIRMALLAAGSAMLTLVLQSDVARVLLLAGMFFALRGKVWAIPVAITGFLCGMTVPGFAILFCAGASVYWLAEGKRREDKKDGEGRMRLVITIPEDLRVPGVFDDVLKRYTTRYTIAGMRTVDLGLFLEVTYLLEVPQGLDMKHFLNELRGLNGNLSVALMEEGEVIA